MANRGNPFEEMRRRLEGLKSPQFQATLAQRCGAAAMKTTADCFRQSRDPYGRAWKRLRMRAGMPLLDTGALAASISAQPGPGWFRLVAPKKYAAVHQFGATIKPVNGKYLAWGVRGRKGKVFAKQVTIPARPFFPDAARGIPRDMAEAFDEEFRELVREVVTG